MVLADDSLQKYFAVSALADSCSDILSGSGIKFCIGFKHSGKSCGNQLLRIIEASGNQSESNKGNGPRMGRVGIKNRNVS